MPLTKDQGHCCLTAPTTPTVAITVSPRDQFRPSGFSLQRGLQDPHPIKPLIILHLPRSCPCSCAKPPRSVESPHVVQCSLFSASAYHPCAPAPIISRASLSSASESCHGSCPEVCPPRDPAYPRAFFYIVAVASLPHCNSGTAPDQEPWVLGATLLCECNTHHPSLFQPSISSMPVPLILTTFYYSGHPS